MNTSPGNAGRVGTAGHRAEWRVLRGRHCGGCCSSLAVAMLMAGVTAGFLVGECFPVVRGIRHLPDEGEIGTGASTGTAVRRSGLRATAFSGWA